MTKEIIVRRLIPEDAPALTVLILRCYGETYGPSVFYDTPALAKLISTKKLCSVVAEAGQRIVGHMGLTVRHPESIVCETGNTVVDKSSRGQGLLLKLGMAQYLPQKH
jgi:Acetyltransferase (GNAT) family